MVTAAGIVRIAYAETFDIAAKRVIKIGIAFSSEQRTMGCDFISLIQA